MGLFGNKREGGLMDVIRCDESDYLVWKWSPANDGRSTRKENAIRYGSSLRVKAGEEHVRHLALVREDGDLRVAHGERGALAHIVVLHVELMYDDNFALVRPFDIFEKSHSYTSITITFHAELYHVLKGLSRAQLNFM